MSDTKFIHANVVIEGRCMDLLLTEDQIVDGFKNALSNPSYIPAAGQNWPCQRPDRCSIIDRIMNRCCDCENERNANGS